MNDLLIQESGFFHLTSTPFIYGLLQRLLFCSAKNLQLFLICPNKRTLDCPCDSILSVMQIMSIFLYFYTNPAKIIIPLDA